MSETARNSGFCEHSDDLTPRHPYAMIALVPFPTPQPKKEGVKMDKEQGTKKADHTIDVGKFYYKPEDNDQQNTCTWTVDVTIDGKQNLKGYACVEKPENDYDEETHEAMFDRAAIQAFAQAAQKASVRIGETLLNIFNNVIYRVTSTDVTPRFIADGGSGKGAQLLVVERLPRTSKQTVKMVKSMAREELQRRGEYIEEEL